MNSKVAGVHSMTGYGTITRDHELGRLTLELRSVNSRYLDLSFRLPDELRGLEPLLRESVLARVTRGKIDCRAGVQHRVATRPEVVLRAGALEALQASEEWDPARNQVALLSCGAFGMPLAHHAVRRGVAAVYVGGRMPALFGIIGAVDRELPAVRKRMNAHWQPPLTIETPSQKGRDQFHGNSYWG
jgi:hypothetical protein